MNIKFSDHPLHKSLFILGREFVLHQISISRIESSLLKSLEIRRGVGDLDRIALQ